MNILVVDESVLSGRTTVMMYEASGCDVFLAASVEQALAEVAAHPVNAVVVACPFVKERGLQLREGIKAPQPDTRIAAFCERRDPLPDQCPAVGFYVRPSHFLSDLLHREKTSSGSTSGR